MIRRIIGLGLLAGLTWATPALAQEARCPEPACAAVAGGRTEGWAAQSRAEVIARNGMVTSSQPLATQAGLAILRKGGNAVDAVKRFVECGGRDELGGKGDERWGGVECDG